MGSQQGDSTVNGGWHPLSKGPGFHLSLTRPSLSFFTPSVSLFFPLSLLLPPLPFFPCILSDWPAVSALISIASQSEENMKANGGWGPVTTLRVKLQVSN